MSHLSYTEVVRSVDMFYFSLYGDDTYERWKTMKQNMNFATEHHFVRWMLDIVERHSARRQQHPHQLGNQTPGGATPSYQQMTSANIQTEQQVDFYDVEEEQQGYSGDDKPVKREPEISANLLGDDDDVEGVLGMADDDDDDELGCGDMALTSEESQQQISVKDSEQHGKKQKRPKKKDKKRKKQKKRRKSSEVVENIGECVTSVDECATNVGGLVEGVSGVTEGVSSVDAGVGCVGEAISGNMAMSSSESSESSEEEDDDLPPGIVDAHSLAGVEGKFEFQPPERNEQVNHDVPASSTTSHSHSMTNSSSDKPNLPHLLPDLTASAAGSVHVTSCGIVPPLDGMQSSPGSAASSSCGMDMVPMLPGSGALMRYNPDGTDMALLPHTPLYQVPTPDKPYPCVTCSASFANRQQLAQHQNTVHVSGMEYRCKHCENVFFSKSDRLSHIIEDHADVVRCHSCELCGQKFTTRSVMLAHQRAVHTQRELMCTFCDKTFNWPQALTLHKKRVHLGMCFTCEICQKRLSSKQALLNHITKLHKDVNALQEAIAMEPHTLQPITEDMLKQAALGPDFNMPVEYKVPLAIEAPPPHMNEGLETNQDINSQTFEGTAPPQVNQTFDMIPQLNQNFETTTQNFNDTIEGSSHINQTVNTPPSSNINQTLKTSLSLNQNEKLDGTATQINQTL